MLLVIDNYDSFVFNLARYFQRLGQETCVVRNDAIEPAAVRAMAPDAIVLSPGPCTPDQAGCSVELVRHFQSELPILGVCLGHQAVAVAFGAKIVRAAAPMHGRTSEVFHDDRGCFAELPNPLTACRYHSLVVDPAVVPDCLEVSARTADGVIMALRHRSYPIVGVQFHPESILTQMGYRLLASFLIRAGITIVEHVPPWHDEQRDVAAEPVPLPDRPLTF